ncbi:MAG: M3 family oligoendopeptidase [Anaerolineae bacterium]|nr:MAG: M3 family oligoendopeptidase [Anaerolineae bacterium]
MTEATATTQLGRWDLKDLYPGPATPELEAGFKELEARVAKFEGLREKLSADMDFEEFMDALEHQEASQRIANRIQQYAGLYFSEDTQNQTAQTMQAKVDQFMATMENRTLFFSLWWKSLDDKAAERLAKDSGEFKYFLHQIRTLKPYTLTEPEEKILNIKNVTGRSALQTLYSMITDRYVFRVTVDGEVKELTRGQLMSLVQGPNPDIRAAAYQELYKVYGNDGPILGQMYQTLVRDYHNENLDLRGFQSPIAVRNLGNDIPDDVVETLLNVAQKNAGVFQRFFKLKAKWLKVKKLRRYDIYAPVSASDKKYDWTEAVQMTMDSFKGFAPKVEELARRVFDENHIDSEVRKGKRGGAFCSSGDPAVTPFVLVNYDGTARDVSTLAHELGHAIHAMLAEHHNVFTFHSTLPLAETASTFAEMVLVDYMLSHETDESVKRDILFAQVDDNYATIMRQIFFAIFERSAHQKVQEGASVDELSAAYMENLKTQFGDSLEIGEEFKWEWVSIPHIFYYPFYVYAYAFGQLLVLALYQQFKKEGQSFVPRFLEVLSSGGSKPPVEILDAAGIDIRKAEFWQGGFDVLAGMVAELEALPAP